MIFYWLKISLAYSWASFKQATLSVANWWTRLFGRSRLIVSQISLTYQSVEVEPHTQTAFPPSETKYALTDCLSWDISTAFGRSLVNVCRDTVLQRFLTPAAKFFCSIKRRFYGITKRVAGASIYVFRVSQSRSAFQSTIISRRI